MADLCKHHELILQYAEDAQKYAEPWKLWQVENWDEEWLTLFTHPAFAPSRNYRRKPRTIRIGEYDVPEPIRVEPEDGAKVYIADAISSEYFQTTIYEPDYSADSRAFKRGLLHTTPAAAELHGRALASLTSDA